MAYPIVGYNHHHRKLRLYPTLWYPILKIKQYVRITCTEKDELNLQSDVQYTV